MSDAPSGWYEDPNRYGAERYWDGSGWTDQQRFVTLLDVELRAPRLRTTMWRLVASGEHLAWNDESMKWDEATDFDSTIVEDNRRRPALYKIEVSSGKNRLRIELPADDEGRAESAFRAVVDIANRVITPRFTHPLFPRADAGEVIQIKKVDFSPQGFGKAKNPIPWTEYAGWNMGAGNYFQIWKKSGEKKKRAFYFPTTQLDRWILTVMLNDYAERYRNPQPS